MLVLKDFNINYNKKNIVYVNEIHFNSGTITGIIGKSGSGKSSILNCIYGNYKIDNYEYNGKQISNITQFAKNNISYITQEVDLLNFLTCRDYIEFVLSISTAPFTTEELFQIVQLEISPHSYPQNLSGGEKRKFALAVGLAKNADILLCDEITASLDYESSVEIVSLLKTIATNYGKIIIITSHDKYVEKMCDVLYEIKDNKVNCIKKNDNSEKSKNFLKVSPNININWTHYFKLVKEMWKYNVFNRSLVILFFAVAICLCVTGYQASGQYKSYFKRYSQLLNANQSYILLRDYSFDTEQLMEISTEINQYLSNNNEIEEYYPFAMFERGKSSINKDVSNVMESEQKTSYKIKITEGANVREIDDLNYTNEYYDGYILPYYSQPNMDLRCEDLVENEGVYISKEFANLLGIKKLEENTKVTLTFSVPITINTIEYKAENGDLLSSIVSPLYKTVEKEFNIRGILDYRYVQVNSATQIFIDCNQMYNILEENFEDMQEVNIEVYDISQDITSQVQNTGLSAQFITMLVNRCQGLNSSYPISLTIGFQPYVMSDYCIFTQDVTVLNKIQTDIRKINSEYSLVNDSYNLQSLSLNYEKQENYISIYTISIFIILFILSIVYSKLNEKERRKIYSPLIHIGFDSYSIKKYICVDSISYIIIFIFICIPLFLLIQWIGVLQHILIINFNYEKILLDLIFITVFLCISNGVIINFFSFLRRNK